MKSAIYKIKDINPAKYNPRVTLKPGDKEWEDLKASIEHSGMVKPLVVNEKTGTLISGHQRLNVLKATGAEEVEVVLVSVDEEQEKLLNISLNKIEADTDYEKLEQLFKEIPDDLMAYTGYSPEEILNLYGEIPAPTFEEPEPEEETEKSEKAAADKPSKIAEFNIFISFPTKEAAEKWLKEHGVEEEFEKNSRNMTIRMEGTDFGKRS